MTSEPSGLCCQPVGRDEGAHGDDGADREIDLPGDDDERLADRDDADERRRQHDLIEVRAGSRKRGSRSVTAAQMTSRATTRTQLADAQQASDEAAGFARREHCGRIVCGWVMRRASGRMRRAVRCVGGGKQDRLAIERRRARASAAMRPPRNTMMRSAIAITSSASSPIRMIAIPCVARCEMMRWISAFAPTSMPRVG